MQYRNQDLTIDYLRARITGVQVYLERGIQVEYYPLINLLIPEHVSILIIETANKKRFAALVGLN
jgi:hypothetical protein